MTIVVVSVAGYFIVLAIVVSYLTSLGYVKVLRTPLVPVPYGYLLTHILTVSSIALCSFLTLLTLGQSRRLRSVEAQVGSFVGSVANYLTSGSSLYEALSLALRDVRGYFRSLMERLVVLLSLGFSIEDAISEVLRDAGREYRYALVTLAIAERSGGASDKVLYEASRILNDLYMFREYRRRVLRQYFYVSIMAVVVYNLALLIVIKLLASLNGMAMMGSITAVVDAELMYSFMYYTSVMIAASVGIAYGKCIEGSVRRSFIYVLVLLAINFTTIYVLTPLFSLGVPAISR